MSILNFMDGIKDSMDFLAHMAEASGINNAMFEKRGIENQLNNFDVLIVLAGGDLAKAKQAFAPFVVSQGETADVFVIKDFEAQLVELLKPFFKDKLPAGVTIEVTGRLHVSITLIFSGELYSQSIPFKSNGKDNFASQTGLKALGLYNDPSSRKTRFSFGIKDLAAFFAKTPLLQSKPVDKPSNAPDAKEGVSKGNNGGGDSKRLLVPASKQRSLSADFSNKVAGTDGTNGGTIQRPRSMSAPSAPTLTR